jgi:hypothetical protein
MGDSTRFERTFFVESPKDTGFSYDVIMLMENMIFRSLIFCNPCNCVQSLTF